MRITTTTTLALAALGLWACHFDVAGVLVSFPSEDLAIVDGAVVDLPRPEDLAGPDLAGLCAPGGPSSACSADGSELITCLGMPPMPTPRTCSDGCSSEGGPHCRRLDPGGPAEPADYEKPGLVDVTLNGVAVFNTDTGEITATPIDRMGGVGVSSGIGFRTPTQSNGSAIGVFSFASLTIAAGAEVNVVGQKPLALVAAGNITIEGLIDVQGSCSPGVAIAGGGLGGASKAGTGNPGGGLGAGLGGAVSVSAAGGGGGGGGFGDIGGTGATGSTGGTGGAAGPLFGDLTLADPILSGGGGGGAGGGPAGGGAGGAGGGALQIASNGTITLSATAVIQAGGCHGSATSSSVGGVGGGGGGGAGGAILIEGRTVQIGAGAALTVNGGGGGGGGGGTDGDDGQRSTTAALGGSGGSSSTKGSDGGDGGATGMLFGGKGLPLSSSQVHGGGGGGGVGRIALKSRSGSVTTTGVELSPKIDEATAGRAAPARTGTVTFR